MLKSQHVLFCAFSLMVLTWNEASGHPPGGYYHQQQVRTTHVPDDEDLEHRPSYSHKELEDIAPPVPRSELQPPHKNLEHTGVKGRPLRTGQDFWQPHVDKTLFTQQTTGKEHEFASRNQQQPNVDGFHVYQHHHPYYHEEHPHGDAFPHYHQHHEDHKQTGNGFSNYHQQQEDHKQTENGFSNYHQHHEHHHQPTEEYTHHYNHQQNYHHPHFYNHAPKVQSSDHQLHDINDDFDYSKFKMYGSGAEYLENTEGRRPSKPTTTTSRIFSDIKPISEAPEPAPEPVVPLKHYFDKIDAIVKELNENETDVDYKPLQTGAQFGLNKPSDNGNFNQQKQTVTDFTNVNSKEFTQQSQSKLDQMDFITKEQEQAKPEDLSQQSQTGFDNVKLNGKDDSLDVRHKTQSDDLTQQRQTGFDNFKLNEKDDSSNLRQQTQHDDLTQQQQTGFDNFKLNEKEDSSVLHEQTLRDDLTQRQTTFELTGKNEPSSIRPQSQQQGEGLTQHQTEFSNLQWTGKDKSTDLTSQNKDLTQQHQTKFDNLEWSGKHQSTEQHKDLTQQHQTEFGSLHWNGKDQSTDLTQQHKDLTQQHQTYSNPQIQQHQTDVSNLEHKERIQSTDLNQKSQQTDLTQQHQTGFVNLEWSGKDHSSEVTQQHGDLTQQHQEAVGDLESNEKRYSIDLNQKSQQGDLTQQQQTEWNGKDHVTDLTQQHSDLAQQHQTSISNFKLNGKDESSHGSSQTHYQTSSSNFESTDLSQTHHTGFVNLEWAQQHRDLTQQHQQAHGDLESNEKIHSIDLTQKTQPDDLTQQHQTDFGNLELSGKTQSTDLTQKHEDLSQQHQKIFSNSESSESEIPHHTDLTQHQTESDKLEWSGKTQSTDLTQHHEELTQHQLVHHHPKIYSYSEFIAQIQQKEEQDKVQHETTLSSSESSENIQSGADKQDDLTQQHQTEYDINVREKQTTDLNQQTQQEDLTQHQMGVGTLYLSEKAKSSDAVLPKQSESNIHEDNDNSKLIQQHQDFMKLGFADYSSQQKDLVQAHGDLTQKHQEEEQLQLQSSSRTQSQQHSEQTQDMLVESQHTIDLTQQTQDNDDLTQQHESIFDKLDGGQHKYLTQAKLDSGLDLTQHTETGLIHQSQQQSNHQHESTSKSPKWHYNSRSAFATQEDISSEEREGNGAATVETTSEKPGFWKRLGGSITSTYENVKEKAKELSEKVKTNVGY